MQWDPVLLHPERREGGGGAGGSDVRELHKKQTPSSTVQTEHELLAQHGLASAPKSTGSTWEALGRCHGAGEQQQQHRVHRFSLPGKQICWHSRWEASLVGSPRGSLCPLIASHMPSPAPDSFLPGQDYQDWQTSHWQGQERASHILPSADPCLQPRQGVGWDGPGGIAGAGLPGWEGG